MSSLIEDLESKQASLDQFKDLTVRVPAYLPNIVTDEVKVRGFILFRSVAAGTTKRARPLNEALFIRKKNDFIELYKQYTSILKMVSNGEKTFKPKHHEIVNSVTYTIQQAIGIGLDFLANQNSARKHTGNRFEELIRLIVSEIGIQNKKIVLKIPYGDSQTYSAETDLVFSPYKVVRSDNSNIDPREVVVALKTSSKDRMGKIFIDKLLMERFVKHDVKVIGIFLNDVQRKEDSGISFTFVSGLFMVYSKFLTTLEGAYFIDLPSGVESKPYNQHIFPFSKFILEDASKLIS